MIDFRYHLVSIIAVFLALTIGIVVGTAALNGPVLEGLRSSIHRLTADKRALEAEVRDLRSGISASDGFARTVGPAVVGDALADRGVLVVATPDTPPGLVDELVPVLEEAGGQVTGRLQLLAPLVDPAQSQLIDDLVAGVVPAGLDLPETGPVDRAAVQLAASLVQREQRPAVSDEAADAIVSAYAEAGLVQLTESADVRQVATLAVVVTGPPVSPAEDVDPGEHREALLRVVRAFAERAEATVVAGSTEAALDPGLLAGLRDDTSLGSQVSTVDDLDRAHGRLAVVLALREQVEGRGTGSYGRAPGASAPVPSPRP